MYYELYLDSIFMLNFCMNLYLLLLVNRVTGRTATRLRLVIGAAAGSAGFLLPLIGSALGIAGQGGAAMIAIFLLGMLTGTVGMLFLTFRIRSAAAFLALFQKFLLYSFLLGGFVLFVIRILPWIRTYLTTAGGILILGAFGCMLVSRYREGKSAGHDCHCLLIGARGSMKVQALIDTGNSLIEPISGKPVSIMDPVLFRSLWEEESPYRAIPYTSIGKKRGILKGYLLKEMRIERNGMEKICRDVYVAVSEEGLGGDSSIRVILHPALWDGDQKA